MQKDNEIKIELKSLGETLIKEKLTWGNAGNISAKSDDHIYITASGTNLGELNEDDVIDCSLSSLKKPSKELPMHLAIYEERSDINAVIHASPFYSTLIACSNIKVPSELFVESMYYLEKIERVEYQHPGSQELADKVRERAKGANIILLENHGVLVYDISIKEALMSLQTLEFTCKMIVETSEKPIELNLIDLNKTNDFLNHSGYRPRREWGK